MRRGDLECVGSARKGITIHFRSREVQEEGRSTAGESVETRLNALTLEFERRGSLGLHFPVFRALG